MAEQWFVVRTKQARETVAACSIASEGFHVFLPVRLIDRSHAGKRERVSRPLFPRYLFVQFDKDTTQFGKLNFCRGVASKGLMCSAMDRPLVVPDKIIADIRDRERVMLAEAGKVTSGYHAGDTFPLQKGPWASIEATYMGEELGQVMVSVTLLGREHIIWIPFEEVPIPERSVDRLCA